MFQHETQAHSTETCPDCGSALHTADELLHCDDHGDFFRYGPRLLVHCALELRDQPILTLLPWERLSDRAPA